jgi:hypothetical protein
MEPGNFYRRMPRVEKIPLMKIPDDLFQMIEDRLYLGDSRSVFVIRDYFLSTELDGSFEKRVVKELDTGRLKRYKTLKQEINAEKSIETLFELLSRENNIEIRNCIYKRLIEMDVNVYNKFLEELKAKYSEECYDAAFIVLGMVINKTDISNEIIEFLNGNYIRDPSDFSSMIQLLGYRKNEINLQYMYTYYNFFVNNFEHENYFEGPIIGLGNYYNRLV